MCAVSTTVKSLNLIIHDAKNNDIAALIEKAPSDHHNNEDNVIGSTKVLAMRIRMHSSSNDFKCFLYMLKNWP